MKDGFARTQGGLLLKSKEGLFNKSTPTTPSYGYLNSSLTILQILNIQASTQSHSCMNYC